jgi:hypothetical protein
MPNEYTALEGLQAPGTMVFGYQRGDAVPADVVERWGLEVGTQVVEGDLTDDTPASAAAVRPGPEGTRSDWEAWAVANGMPADEAAERSLEDLESYESDAEPAAVAGTDRPADSARKSEWVAYAKRLGADPEWADSPDTLKADLQAFEPAAGDSVAVEASELDHG